MLLGQIEGFVEVARQGSVTRAAESLSLTQPALTTRLQALERELGTELLTRAGRGVKLTDAGRAFLPYAQRVLDTLSQGRAAMGELARGRVGRLALGAAPAVSTYVLPGVLKRFRASHPEVRVSVRTGHSEEILEMVLREEVELGLTRELRHPAIESAPLYEDELLLVVDPSHRFATRDRIRLEDVTDEQLIMFDRTSSWHEQTQALFRQAGVVLRDVMELDNIDAAKKMVEQGLGIALLPRSAVAAELRNGALRHVAIADASALRRHIVAIRRRDAGPALGVVASFLQTFQALGGLDGTKRTTTRRRRR